MALQQLFTDIADAIREKDGSTDDIVASTFPERIRAIPSGGGSGPANPLDPVEVYMATRPDDWLPMPEPQDNEMYLLFHIPDGVSSLLAFTVTCTGSYTVALGTVTGGQFVQQSAVSLASNTKYEMELFADDWGGLTSDGFKQVMIKVSGTDITKWEPSTHSKKSSPANFSVWNIMEIACRLPAGTKVACGSSTVTKALRKLRYFAWYGENALTNMSAMFTWCNSLITIPALDTSNVTNMSYLFQNCSSLTTIPLLNTSNVTAIYDAFNNCYSLFELPALDIGNVTNMNAMFQYCGCLTSIPFLDIRKVTSASSTFANCYALAKLTINPDVANWAGADISLSGCSLGHQALVDLLNSLPTITASHTLTLTSNPGVSELTAAEQSIATGKGWTLTL